MLLVPPHWLPHVTLGLMTAPGQFLCHPPRLDGTPAMLLFTGTRTLRDLVVDDLDVTPAFWPDPDDKSTGGVVGGYARRTRTLLQSPPVANRAPAPRLRAGRPQPRRHVRGPRGVQLDQVLDKEVRAVATFGLPLARKGFQRYYADTLGSRSRHSATPRGRWCTASSR